MIEIIPSLLVESKKEFEKKLRAVEDVVKTVQVDILDGSLFPFTNWFHAPDVSAIQTPVSYELHLMVRNPLPIIEEWKAQVPRVVRAIFHAEACRPMGTLVELIHQNLKMEVGVALNPETPISEIHDILHVVDEVLVMSVHPGASGQSFLGEPILEKIRELRRHRPDMPIAVDGGITQALIPTLVEAGATRLCMASAIFSQDNPSAFVRQLQDMLK